MSFKTIEEKFESVLSSIGKDFEKGLAFAVKYAAPVASLVALLFPATVAADSTVVTATDLIQNAVLVVEQKYAASGAQSGTGAQKLSEVLTLTQAAVTNLLAQEGITANTAYITSLVNAVVAILNAQPATSTAAPVTSAAETAATETTAASVPNAPAAETNGSTEAPATAAE
jgi:hypothetical protein